MAEDAAPVETPLLNTFLAALAELEEAERVRFCRAYLEYGLDLLEANELEHFRFLGECALLAVDNMQDVRLENVELRVQALEQPPEKPWGEVLTEVMLGLALSLAALAVAEATAAAVISVAGYRAMLAAKSAAQAQVVLARSGNAKVRKLLEETVAEHAEAKRVAERLELMTKGGYVSRPARRGGWLIEPGWGGDAPFHLPQDALQWSSRQADPGPFIRKHQELAAKVALAESASGTSAKRVEAALEAFDQALIDGRSAEQALKKEWGKDWRELIGGEQGGVLLSLTSSVIKGASEGTSVRDAPPGPDRPFLTSEVAARYLDWVAEERMAVSSSYANMRFVLRTTSDADIVAGDDYIRYLAFLATEVTASWEAVRQDAQSERSLFVEAFEATFWREYLSANGLLAVHPVAEYSSRESWLEPGTVVGGHLILGKLDDDPASHFATNVPGHTRYRSWHLPGAMRLDARLAGVLYHRFAGPHFAVSENASTLMPFKHEPSVYANVAIPPADGFWGFPDPEAVRRINEMRHMVIRFFADEDALRPPDHLVEAAARLGFLGSVAGERADKSRTAWLAATPQGVDPSGQDAGLAEILSTVEAEAQVVALAGAPQRPGDLTVQAHIVRLDFAAKLNDLNQDVQVYQFLAAGAIEPADAGGRTKEELLDEIEREKTALTLAWNTLQAMVAEGQEEQILPYQAAYEAVIKWQPGSAWVWYGPDAQPEPQ